MNEQADDTKPVTDEDAWRVVAETAAILRSQDERHAREVNGYKVRIAEEIKRHEYAAAKLEEGTSMLAKQLLETQASYDEQVKRLKDILTVERAQADMWREAAKQAVEFQETCDALTAEVESLTEELQAVRERDEERDE